MASIQWPTSLPQRPIAGMNEKLASSSLVTQMDVGPPKSRPRNTKSVRTFDLTFQMTEAEVATFETFYETTAKNGTRVFDYTHPRTGASHEFKFLEDPAIVHMTATVYRIQCKWVRVT